MGDIVLKLRELASHCTTRFEDRCADAMEDAAMEIERLRLAAQQDGVREATIEECAKIAELAGCGDPKCMGCYGNQIAAEIRELRSLEQKSEG